MNEVLRQLVRAEQGVLPWAAAVDRVPEHVLSYAVRAGHLTVPFPGVLLDPELLGDPAAQRRAALICAGPGAALSHTSALATWHLPVPDPEPLVVHVMTGPQRRIRVPGIVAHRRTGFVPEPPHAVIREGVPVTRIEQSIVDSWPLASADQQRAPLLHAVNERMTTAPRIAEVAARTPCLPGRAELDALLGKVAAGCRSELELWGHDRVFTGHGMPAFARQVPVRLPGGTVYLDLLDQETGTNIELDGAKYHGSPAQRERDLRRDAALIALGLVVVRFTHDRLVREADEVRREVLAIISARRSPQSLDTYRGSWRGSSR